MEARSFYRGRFLPLDLGVCWPRLWSGSQVSGVNLANSPEAKPPPICLDPEIFQEHLSRETSPLHFSLPHFLDLRGASTLVQDTRMMGAGEDAGAGAGADAGAGAGVSVGVVAGRGVEVRWRSR